MFNIYAICTSFYSLTTLSVEEHTSDKHESRLTFSEQFLAVGGMYLFLFCLFVSQWIFLFKSMLITFYSEEGEATVPCTRISKILGDSQGF